MLPSDKIETLKGIFLFSCLSSQELQAVASVATEITWQGDELIIAAGRVPSRLIILLNGTTRGLEGEKEIVLNAPLILGASEILLDKESNVNWYSAQGSTRGLVIQRSHFLTIVNQCPRVLTGIFNYTNKATFNESSHTGAV